MDSLPAPPRKVSQCSIARDLGLSQAAVSHVLNGKRENCHPRTYERIWSHALAVGYRGKGFVPDAMPGATLTHVGIVHGDGLSGDRPSAFLSSLQWALENRLAARGIAAWPLGSTEFFRDRVFDELVRHAAVKPGVVILGPVSVAFLRNLQAHTHRIVTAGSSHPEIAPGVLNGDAHAADLLVSDLRNRGHTRFSWFGGDGSGPALSARMAAVRTATRQAEAHFQTNYAVSSPKPGRAAGHDCANAFLRRINGDDGPVPTAIICSDGLVARGAIDEFGRAGISVPEEVSVAALDFTSGGGDEFPRVTVAASRPEMMGTTVAELLADYPVATSGRFQPIVLPATLAAGATTGPAFIGRRKRWGTRSPFHAAEPDLSAREPHRLTA